MERVVSRIISSKFVATRVNTKTTSTKRYSKHKDFNLNLKDLIDIKKSTIPKAGKGAFAKTRIGCGTRIGEYNGRLHDYASYENLNDKLYVFEVAKKHKDRYHLFFIDAKKEGGYLRYVNGAMTSAQRKKINVEAYQYGERIFFRANKNIKPGQEILIDYGDNYWP